MSVLPLASVFLALTLPAAAMKFPVHEDPGGVFESSQRDPSRLHALIVSATWCHACAVLHERFESYSPSTGSMASAVWALTEIDRLPNGRMKELLSSEGGQVGDSLPTVIVLRAGHPLGYSTVGSDLGGIERFLNDAAALTPRTSYVRPRLTCRGASEWPTYTLGVSGYMSEKNRTTDWFGREMLLAFRGGESRSPARLLAPARVSSATLAPSPSGTGAFYAADQTLEFGRLFGPVEASTQAVARLAEAPGFRLRLILAGGGQFGPAFMPLPGAAPACAAFATLPDKTAEGCYVDAASKREDYVASVSHMLTCSDKPGRSRARHYRAAASSSGRDVPMLSSEYFLLYGPGAAFLGRGERLPAPSQGLLLKKFDDGVEVLFDLVGGAAVAARRGGKSLPLPRVSIVDCRDDTLGSPNFFFLREPAGPRDGRRGSACAPVVALEWDAPEPARRVMKLSRSGYDPDMERYEPASVYGRDRLSDFSAFFSSSPTVDGRGLRPEAKALLAVVAPRFARPLAGAALVASLATLGDEIRPRDPDLADALAVLTKRAQAQARKTKEQRAPRVSDTLGAIFGNEKSAPIDPDDGFSAEKLGDAMLDNLSPKEIGSEDVVMARLAHLAAAASAESALRASASTSTEAATLASQLDALKLCERGVLD